ncbi:MAG: FKBP-type peptidyl-prolyl cis-trans isomerase [Muribaculaceae bacterium]|nr:FKBP-type peptidyl-prolyl cis-trans isomerase [Muribaculaceae bacterium]
MATDTITPGQYVEIAYDLYTVGSDGHKDPVHTVEPSQPEAFIYGITPGLVEGLATRLAGMKAGDTFDVSVPAEKGFLYSPDDVVTLPIDIFTDDEGQVDTDRVKPGAELPMITADGYQITGIVKSLTADNVTMDFNHPLVGKDLHFTGRVLTVREPSPEELRPYMGGCGGCGGGGSGSDCGSDGCCGGCGN